MSKKSGHFANDIRVFFLKTRNGTDDFLCYGLQGKLVTNSREMRVQHLNRNLPEISGCGARNRV
jgi:hypothetical protein